MSQQDHKSQRTEKPTARRLKKARDQGQVARSKELPGAMALAAFLIFAHFLGPSWLDRMRALMVAFLGSPGPEELTTGNFMTMFRDTASSTGMLLMPPLGMLMFAGVAGNLLQGQLVLTLKPLEPKFDRLNPFTGIKKVVSLKQWVEMIKSFLKMALFGAVAYTAARDVIANSPAASPGIEGTLQMLFTLAGTVLIRVTAVAAGLAVLDWLFRRYDHTRNLMMSKREIKEEHKEAEGDPTVRARIRQKQLTLARTRMMADVPQATVVITNPTHYAVALRYVPGETTAPKLLAKGRALVAARIRSVAEVHGIPIVSDPPLARALYRSAPIGADIPPALFRAVAEVLALVFQRRDPRSFASEGAGS